jgi:hypothetical protein
MSEQTSIKCPNCGTSIDVNDILKHQLEDKMNKMGTSFKDKANELLHSGSDHQVK